MSKGLVEQVALRIKASPQSKIDKVLDKWFTYVSDDVPKE